MPLPSMHLITESLNSSKQQYPQQQLPQGGSFSSALPNSYLKQVGDIHLLIVHDLIETGKYNHFPIVVPVRAELTAYHPLNIFDHIKRYY